MEKEEEMERDWNHGIGKAIVREEVCGGEAGGKKRKIGYSLVFWIVRQDKSIFRKK